MLRQLAVHLCLLPHRPSAVADEGVRNIFSRLGLIFKTKRYSKLMGLENSNEALSAPLYCRCHASHYAALMGHHATSL